MDVKVNIDERNNERLEILKARKYPKVEQQKVEKMVPALYEAAKKGDVGNFIDTLQRVSVEKSLTLDTIFNQVSPSGNSLLHVAENHRSKEIFELIACHFPFLITKQNHYGDTPLHIAVNTTETLVNLAREYDDMSNDVGSLLRIKNEEGNTALHEAVMNCNRQKVQFLVKADSEVAYYQNNKFKSPLYLAAQSKDEQIFNIILQAIETDCDSLNKLEGKSPMYAAIKRKKIDMLKEIVIKKPELMHYKYEKGRTPLHWAASIGYLDGVKFLLSELSEGALESDKKGLYPIHIACKNGHVDVTNELLRKWPDPVELLSNKGQNILHFAAKSGQVDVVKFLLKTPQLGDTVDTLLNKKDHEGNTPLHLATIRGHYYAVWSLARRKRDCLNLKNKEGLTAYDMADRQSTRDSMSYHHYIRRKDKQIVDNERLKPDVVADEKTSTMAESKKSKEPDYFDTMMALSVLNVLQFTNPGFGSVFRKRIIKSRRPSQQEINNRINALMVVAALAAGATFGASVNMPGKDSGSNSCGGGDKNPREWIKDITIPTFALLNTASLKLSLFTAVIILWAQLGDITLTSIAVWMATGVLLISLYTMCLAFFVAVITGLLDYPKTFFGISMLEILLVIGFTIFSIPIFLPIKYKRVFMLCITFLIFCSQYINKEVIAMFWFCGGLVCNLKSKQCKKGQ